MDSHKRSISPYSLPQLKNASFGRKKKKKEIDLLTLTVIVASTELYDQVCERTIGTLCKYR